MKYTVTIEFDSAEEAAAWFSAGLATKSKPARKVGRPKKAEPKAGEKEFFSNKRGNKLWTEDEETFIFDHFSTKSLKWIAHQLGRTPAAIQMKAAYMRKQGLAIPKKRNYPSRVQITRKDGSSVTL